MSRPIWPRSSAVAVRIRSSTVPAIWPKYSHQSAVDERKASRSAATTSTLSPVSAAVAPASTMLSPSDDHEELEALAEMGALDLPLAHGRGSNSRQPIGHQRRHQIKT